MISCLEFLGPGPLGAPGPRCRIRVVHVTTYCQASYLLSGKPSAVMKLATYCQASYLQSGKLPTVRQATYCQASYLLSGKATYSQASYLQSGKATYSQAKLPTVRQSYLQSGMHPTTAYMHPTEP